MTLFAFGLNHTTAPLEVREKVTFHGEILPGALADLSHQKGVAEAAILSTCNRTEIYCNLDPGDARGPMDWFSAYHGFKYTDLQPFLYNHPDSNAVKHLMRVASGLDSMVLGEPQVLGQLKTAYQTALTAGSVGQLLGRLFQHSFKVAKEIRSNTAIGNHPVSVAFAAVRLSQQIFGKLHDKTVLLIGAGETVELAARHLREKGLRRMIVANRTLQAAQYLAQQYSGYAITLEDISQHLDEADIVISSTGSDAPILYRDVVEDAVGKRKHRPVFMVDIAVPRDIDPAAGELEDVYLYTVDDLKDVIEENIRSRQEAARQAEEIIDTQVVHFMDWMHSLDAVNTIVSLREKAAGIRDKSLNNALSKLRRGADPEAVMRELARTLTNKLVHHPSSQLRNADDARREQLLAAARELYSLSLDQISVDEPEDDDS
jgi:glutamyl-tRNA reductase